MNRVNDSICLFYNWLDLVVIRIGTSNFWSYSINLQSACVLVIQEEPGKAVHMCKEVPAMAPSFQCVLGKKTYLFNLFNPIFSYSQENIFMFSATRMNLHYVPREELCMTPSTVNVPGFYFLILVFWWRKISSFESVSTHPFQVKKK